MSQDSAQDLVKSDWYADPTGRHQYRYWDGSVWTEHVADSGQTSSDPVDAAPATQSLADDAGGTTVVGLLRDFLVSHEDDVTLERMDAARAIVNSGCAPAVVQRYRAQRDPVILDFLRDLEEHGFIARTP
jgi:hypothetical protein